MTWLGSHSFSTYRRNVCRPRAGSPLRPSATLASARCHRLSASFLLGIGACGPPLAMKVNIDRGVPRLAVLVGVQIPPSRQVLSRQDSRSCLDLANGSANGDRAASVGP